MKYIIVLGAAALISFANAAQKFDSFQSRMVGAKQLEFSNSWHILEETLQKLNEKILPAHQKWCNEQNISSQIVEEITNDFTKRTEAVILGMNGFMPVSKELVFEIVCEFRQQVENYSNSLRVFVNSIDHLNGLLQKIKQREELLEKQAMEEKLTTMINDLRGAAKKLDAGFVKNPQGTAKDIKEILKDMRKRFEKFEQEYDY